MYESNFVILIVPIDHIQKLHFDVKKITFSKCIFTYLFKTYYLSF